jgi:crotonobetainyl-CoA:carnitine CoA-transferase CaiB-like acyl-CoA transferase
MTAVEAAWGARRGPLVNIRVVELATIIMGPYAGQLLAGLGADVIKVEPPGGDGSRVMGGGPHPQLSGIALNLHANKRSIVLDVKLAAGRAALLKLLATSDVLVTNFRPEALERLGISYAQLAPRLPRLVYCQAAGFRSDSAESGRPAFDDIISALVGFPALNAEMGREMRFMPSLITDKVCGMAIANGVLAALVSRSSTGSGEQVEVPMFDTMLAFNLVEHLARAVVPGQPPGYTRALATHRGPYRTKDGWIAMMPYADKHWRALFGAVGCEEKLDQPWHRDMATRLLEAEQVYAELAEVLIERTTDEWLALCERLDVPVSPVPTLTEIVSDEQCHRGVLVEEEHPVVGRYRHIRQPMVFRNQPASENRPAPLIGQDGREVLAELGYGDAEIDDLIAAGALITE